MQQTMTPAHQIATLQAELKSARTAAEQNEREDQHWHAKYHEMKEENDRLRAELEKCKAGGV